jgi:4a-hydroxytetrahydrobiopterin dehydratase
MTAEATKTTDGIGANAFEATEGTGDWRVLGDGATAFFRTSSFSASVRFVDAIAALPGIDGHAPDVDIRVDGVTVRLLTYAEDWYGMSQRDVDSARRISAVAKELGLSADPSAVQSVLIIPGAPPSAKIYDFWRAVLGYEPRNDSPEEDLVDPRWRGPYLWFETMSEPRGDGGGAIHISVNVPYEQAEARVAAALAAGGQMVRDEYAPMWWTLADAAGNEADISTIKDRD